MDVLLKGTMIRLLPSRMLRRSLCLQTTALLLTVVTSAHANGPKDSVPDWVQAAIAQPKGTYSPETSAVVLLDEMTLSVGVADRDLLGHAGYLQSTTVAAVMTSDPQTMTPGMTVEDAARLMIAHKISGLPVIDHGKLVGFVTATDVMKAFLQVEAGVESLADE
jgi:signal-transduction protein with cAMP-binding, CBS, and nucleotidyltransferase domain